MSKKEQKNLTMVPYLMPVLVEEWLKNGLVKDAGRAEEIARAIIARYGTDAPFEAMKYTAVRYGISFIRMDAYLQARQTDPERLEALVRAAYAREVEATGGTQCTISELYEAVKKIEYAAGKEEPIRPFYMGSVLNKIGRIDADQTDDAGETVLALKEFKVIETDIAKALWKISRRKHIAPLYLEEDEGADMYDGTQSKAILTACSHGVSVITGGPGTGKTTVIKGIADITELTLKRNVLLLAPTNCASKRLREATERPASTIHSALRLIPGERYISREEIAPRTTVIVDEASMMDANLAHALIEAVECSQDSTLVLIGDADQLESVGAGNVLEDIIASGCYPVTKLTKMYRFANGLLKDVIEKMRAGAWEEIGWNKDDNTFSTTMPIDDLDTTTTAAKAYLQALKRQGGNPLKVRVLCPVRKSTLPVSAHTLNIFLHKYFVQEFGKRDTVRIGGKYTAAVGDPVVMTVNRPDLGRDGFFNGEMGLLYSTNPLRVLVGKEIIELDDKARAALELAYATSVHKAQGGEVEDVIVLLPDCAPGMLSRRMLYVAITRAKQRVAIITQGEALSKAAADEGGHVRRTGLTREIKKYYKKGTECYGQV